MGDGQVAVWQLDDLYTFTLLDHQSQVASVVTQIGNPVTGFTLPIPLAGGIDRIYSLPTDPAQGTLFAVDTLGTLNVLTKDPALGWTQTQVHQDGASLQPVTSWRVQISVLDANRAGVGGGQIQLSTDRPAGFWQASGSTILTPAAPVTLAADSGGKVTVSIPAEELDTAVLTAQALDSYRPTYRRAARDHPEHRRAELPGRAGLADRQGHAHRRRLAARAGAAERAEHQLGHQDTGLRQQRPAAAEADQRRRRRGRAGASTTSAG